MALESVIAVDNGRVLSGGSESSGGGGLTQEEHDWLESISSMPARGDINPGKIYGTPFVLCSYSNTSYAYIPILGYDKVAIAVSSASSTGSTMKFIDNYGQVVSTTPKPSTDRAFTDYVDIPNNAVVLLVESPGTSIVVYYSMLTADSPYNPDNQNP